MPQLPSMPNLVSEDSRESLLHTRDQVQKKARRIWDGFSDFALQDNVLEVAVGLMCDFPFFTLISFFPYGAFHISCLNPYDYLAPILCVI